MAWRRIVSDGEVSYPLGESATGLLIYTEDGRMAVQMLAGNRPNLATEDALGGTLEERAAAYSTCLAYFGTYQVEGEEIVHKVEESLFQNWAGTVQPRPFTLDGDSLVLRTPPAEVAGETVVNEIAWVRSKGT